MEIAWHSDLNSIQRKMENEKKWVIWKKFESPRTVKRLANDLFKSIDSISLYQAFIIEGVRDKNYKGWETENIRFFVLFFSDSNHDSLIGGVTARLDYSKILNNFVATNEIVFSPKDRYFLERINHKLISSHDLKSNYELSWDMKFNAFQKNVENKLKAPDGTELKRVLLDYFESNSLFYFKKTNPPKGIFRESYFNGFKERASWKNKNKIYCIYKSNGFPLNGQAVLLAFDEGSKTLVTVFHFKNNRELDLLQEREVSVNIPLLKDQEGFAGLYSEFSKMNNIVIWQDPWTVINDLDNFFKNEGYFLGKWKDSYINGYQKSKTWGDNENYFMIFADLNYGNAYYNDSSEKFPNRYVILETAIDISETTMKGWFIHPHEVLRIYLINDHGEEIVYLPTPPLPPSPKLFSRITSKIEDLGRMSISFAKSEKELITGLAVLFSLVGISIWLWKRTRKNKEKLALYQEIIRRQEEVISHVKAEMFKRETSASAQNVQVRLIEKGDSD